MRAGNISAHLAKFQKAEGEITGEDVSPQNQLERGEFAMSGGRREQLRNVSVHSTASSTHTAPPLPTPCFLFILCYIPLYFF